MAGNGVSVAVVGLGYVGLTTAVCFAHRGIRTVGLDVDEEKIGKIARGVAPIKERGLDNLLRKGLGTGKLRLTSDYSELLGTRIQFITVGTPGKVNQAIDLSMVKSAARSIGKTIRKSTNWSVVVVKSTVVPGTTSEVVRPAIESSSKLKLGEFGLAANPEFLREGSSVRDTMHPDRLVVGSLDLESERTLLSFYKRFYRSLPTTISTNTTNAELIKYASNAFLATKISFANEIADLCAKLPGADVSVVAEGMGLDRRIGPDFLRAGLGYGGSCFPKDVSAILRFAEQLHVSLSIVRATRDVNQDRPKAALKLVKGIVGNLRGKKIALLGLAFKPHSDDTREAVSLRLISALNRRGAKVVAYDPLARENAERMLGDRLVYAKSAKECIKGADCCVVVTEWPEFSKLNPRDFRTLMRVPSIVDGRRIFRQEVMENAGLRFAAIGLNSGATKTKASSSLP